MNCSSRALATALLIGTTGFAPAMAQGAPDADEDEIIVTAQKRAERLEDVPISITAVTGGQLEAAGVLSVQDMARVVPGLNITRNGTNVYPGIRGISNQTGGILAENNVAVYIDGFYITSPQGLNFDLIDVAQVDVLKGPQGTLFGRNATGGAILISTLAPSLDGPAAKFSASYGRFDEMIVNGYASVPIGETVAVSLTGSLRNSDGLFRDNAGFDAAPVRNRSIRGKLLISPSDSFSMTFAGGYTRNSDASGLTWNIIDAATAPTIVPGAVVETRPYRTSLSYPAKHVADIYDALVKIVGEQGPFTLTSLTYWRQIDQHARYDIDGSPADIAFVDSRTTEQSLSQELNVNYESDRVSAVVGAFYFHDEAASPSIRTGNRGTISLLRNRASTDAVAVYADLTVHATDRLSLIGGLRYSTEQKRVREVLSAGRYFSNPGKDRWNSFTPRAVVQYEVGDRSNVYLSYSKGFKSGTFNVTSGTLPPVRPEKVDAFEIGFKKGGPIRFDVAAYYYDYRDIQVSAIVTNLGGIARQTFLTNAASARIYGAEAQLNAALGDRLTLTAGINYNHARYRDFPNGPATVKDPVTGFNINNQVQDFSGRQMIHAPDLTANVGLDYRAPLAGGELGLNASAYYTSSYTIFNASLDPQGEFAYRQDGFALVNGEISWSAPGKNVPLSLFGRNLTNRTVASLYNGTAFGDTRSYAEPRVVGVRLRAQFGAIR